MYYPEDTRSKSPPKRCMYVCMYVCVCVYVYIYIYIYIYIWTHTHHLHDAYPRRQGAPLRQTQKSHDNEPSGSKKKSQGISQAAQWTTNIHGINKNTIFRVILKDGFNGQLWLLYLQEVIRLETQYWTLVDIPKQEKQETVPAFVLRACAIMEKTQKSGEGVKTSAKLAEEAENRRERIDRLESEWS